MDTRHQARTAGMCLLALILATPLHADKPAAPRAVGSHTGGIASIHFSPDGKWLVSGGGDKVIRLWDVATGKQAREWPGPTSFTCAVRFSPDGKILAAAGYETGPGNAIYLYDVATGKALPRLPGHPAGGIRRLAFTPDGKHLLSGGFDGFVRVWDLATGKDVRQIKVEAGTVYSLSLTSDGALMATAGREGAKLFDVQTGREQPRPAMNKFSCVAVAFSPDGKLLAAGDHQSVKLWEVATGKEVQTLTGFKGEVSQVCFSWDGRTLYSGSYDRAVRLWEVRTGRLIHEIDAHTGWVWGIGLSPDEKQIASCSVDTRLLCWDLTGVARVARKAGPLSSEQVETHLSELSSGDAGVAYRAVCALAGDPAASLPELKARLTRAVDSGPGPAQIARLVRDLDSDFYPVREQGSKELAKMGIHALAALEKALASPPSLEVRNRARRLLARLDPTELPPEDLVALRGVQALEYIGTPEARELLEELARGGAGERLADEAARALRRLNRGREVAASGR